MIIKYSKTRTLVYVLLFCLAPLSFAAPVVNIDDRDLLHNAQALHEYYFKGHNVARYAYSYTDSASYHTAEQYQKLLDAKAVIEEPEFKVDETFLSAFKKLKISSSEQLEFLLSAFSSPIYKASPSLQFLMTLYYPVAYGSSAHTEMKSHMNNRTLWFLGHFIGYYALKPHLKTFLKAMYDNSGYPAVYNSTSHFFASLMSSDTEWEDSLGELGFALVWALSCNTNNEELRNELSFLESCKLSKHRHYTELKELEYESPYLLKSLATAGISKMRLTPAPGYFKDFSGEEKYSYKSLHHAMTKIVKDKTEGLQFFLLYRGEDKYQFFIAGVHQGFMSLSYVVHDHEPTPVLSYLIPLNGMNLEQIIGGIHGMLHQSKSDHDMVPDLQGVWMLSSE